MSPRLPLTPLLALAVLVAGCAAPEPIEEEVEAQPEPVVYPDIFGLVLDPAGDPVAGANVSIDGLGLTNITGSDGAFAFIVEQEGDHLVTASKDGFTDARARITVAPDLAARVVFTIADVTSLPQDVYVDVFRAILPCSVDTPTGPMTCPGFPDDERFRTYNVPLDVGGDLLKSIVLEWHWDPVTAGAERITVLIEDASGTAEAVRVDGGPGLTFEVTPDDLQSLYAHRPDLRITVDHAPDTVFHAQQEVESFTSFFVNQPAPDDYTVQDG